MNGKGGQWPPFSIYSMLSRLFHPLLLLCILAVTVACYLPGLTGSFIFDDGVNITQNSQLRIDSLSLSSLSQAAFSGNAGMLKRPISMTSFALDYYVSGMDARHFKITNLAIHLVNGVLVFFLSSQLLVLYQRLWSPEQSRRNVFWIAATLSAIWLLHPFNLTGVLYVVQRMTSLSTLFTLSGLILYVHGRTALLNGNRSGLATIIAAIFIATPLAALSKENGALLPFLILATEVTLLRWRAPDQNTQRILVMIVGLSTAILALLGTLYLWKHPGLISGGYLTRDFTLIERLMTEARVLWFYIHMILLPNMSMMGLHHDDIPISQSLLSPLSTLPSILGLLFVAGGAFALRNRHPLLAFGTAFFLIGHTLESSIIPLEIAFEHRNYLPMFGILLPLAYYALTPEFHSSSLRLRQASFAILVILFAGLTASRAYQWGYPLQMRTLEAQRHPLSMRANTDIAGLYDHMPARSPEEAMDFLRKALFYYQQAADLSSANISGLFGFLVVKAERGMELDETLIEALEQRLATAPFNPPNVNALIGTARCITSGKCTVSAEIVNKLYSAALSNPTLIGAYRDQVRLEFRGLVPTIQHKIE